MIRALPVRRFVRAAAFRPSALTSAPLCAPTRAFATGLRRTPVLMTPKAHGGVSEADVAAVEQELTMAGLVGRRESLSSDLTEARARLAKVQAIVDAADAKATTFCNAVQFGTFVFLVAQFGVLFNWVFFMFDWNLVEPVTYFIGYSCVWFSTLFYAYTGCEWSYDATRAVVHNWRKDKALAAAGITTAQFEEMVQEVAALEQDRDGIVVQVDQGFDGATA